MKNEWYGYNDEKMVPKEKWNWKKTLALIFAVLFLVGAWGFLNLKLLTGNNWISETYDTEDWRTNEGNLHTNGAWDLEAHIWKSQYIMDNFPNFQWNEEWYMGMPLFKYYQQGFYIAHILFTLITGLNIAKSALFLIIFAHLLAVMLTFLLCYKVSRKIWVSALASFFLIASTFISLRSYGWEPISVVFMFLYPLTLLVFLKAPLKPFRLSVVLLMALTYLAHPLIFFALAMTQGLYLFSIAIRHKSYVKEEHYIWKYFGMIFLALLISAVQFFPQLSYSQVTSGAHMGVSYIPFYHVEYNVISIVSLLFDAGNLKGPSFSILVVAALLIMFLYLYFKDKKSHKNLLNNELAAGFAFVVLMMVVFYYLEMFNIFPMNILRSIQYHRIIPEFIMASAVFIAAVSNIVKTDNQKIIYYGILIAFVLGSFVVIYNVQNDWHTIDSIENKTEFIEYNFGGRITMPYTEQSLSVRSSFQGIPQVYGYYEQGITNSYADEVFSVSSGFHPEDVTLIYLKAANVQRLYVNNEEGERNEIVKEMFNGSLEFVDENERYSYFVIPLNDASLVQAVDLGEAENVQMYKPGCRTMFKEEYCGSVKEEFVTSDYEEIRYLEKYVELVESDYSANADVERITPEFYRINVNGADENTGVIVKMTYDKDFDAYVDGDEIKIEQIGPDYMLLRPNKEGNYVIELKYKTSKVVLIGAIVSILALILTIILFVFKPKINKNKLFGFKRGDL